MQSKCETFKDEYVEEIRQALAVRTKEHLDATCLDQRPKSTVAEHAHKHDVPNSIDWKSDTDR